jgi:hypothetical protein
MNSIQDIKYNFIIERNQFDSFTEFYQVVNAEDKIDFYSLLNRQLPTTIQLKFENHDLFEKYNESYFASKIVDVTDKTLILKHSSLWIRDASHLYKDHIEIEVVPSLNWEIKLDFFFKSKTVDNWIKTIGEKTNAKMIYIIENFESYHLKWFDNETRKIKLMDIDSFDNSKESFDAVKQMMNNMAAHNIW